MEREGFKINLDHMDAIEQQALKKIQEKRQEFMNFLPTIQHDQNIDYFNPSSHAQMQQLLHAPFIPSQKQQIKKVDTNKDP